MLPRTIETANGRLPRPAVVPVPHKSNDGHRCLIPVLRRLTKHFLPLYFQERGTGSV